MKEWEIWVGDYDLGQGYDPPKTPRLLGKVTATTFQLACIIWEHLESIRTIQQMMEKDPSYKGDAHTGAWYYNSALNRNAWTGAYFETEEEALRSFNWRNFKK